LASPEYVPESVLVPVAPTTRLQLPEPRESVPVQLPPVELFTVTVPVGTGVPVLGLLAETWKVAVNVCPKATVVWVELTVVDVPACVTLRLADALLPRNFVSPA
jgi:hypothetical protein